jgi:hypothetical protein
MNMTSQEAIYAGSLGAILGVLYTIGKTAWWGDGTIGDVALFELLASACVGAVAGILAFVIRRKM